MAQASEPDAPAESDAQEDVKRRFREALERKNAQAKSGEGHADSASKIHDAHGPAAAKRTFRRKSG
jgi:hypothetical protein